MPPQSSKKDLEIVYNLQWKNKSDDKANIVGMYDIPATTLNWETFKSYLLKNSGAAEDDVKVSYVSIDDKEFPIESQLDFQIALYSFRQRARNGDVITLKLDRMVDQGRMGRMKRLRRSAEIQVFEESKPEAPPLIQNDSPPDWFMKYMKGLKKEIVDEVTSSIITHMSSGKNPISPQFSCHHNRKSKVDCCKRPRKIALPLMKLDNEKEKNGRKNALGLIILNNDMDKSLKLERRLDCKLEKLEQKTMKIKEKKLALFSKDELNRNNDCNTTGVLLSDTEYLMDASAMGRHETTVIHMSGGETYQQDWEIVNTGDLAWNENTELHYAWGSEALKPLEKHLSCPHLQPGEKGTVSVYLEIPDKPGNYECYWHFHQAGRRFGHWLGCHIIVDPSPIKSALQQNYTESDKERETLSSLSKSFTITGWASIPKKVKSDDEVKNNTLCCANTKNYSSMSLVGLAENQLNISSDHMNQKSEVEVVHDVSSDLDGLKLYDTVIVPDFNSSSDNDNQSIISIADSNSSVHSAPSDEFVVIPMPECIELEKNGDENPCVPLNTLIKLEKAETEEGLVPEDVNFINDSLKTEPTELENDSSYAYVTVNGQKLAVPKHLLRPDYLQTAEDAPNPSSVPVTISESSGATEYSDFNSTMGAFQPTMTISALATLATNTIPTMSSMLPIITPKEEKPDDLLSFKSTTGNCSIDTQEIEKQSQCAPSIYGASETNTLEASQDLENSKSRLFVFPSKCPGFEVVYPPNSYIENIPPEINSDPFYANMDAPLGYPSYFADPWYIEPQLNLPHPYIPNWATSNSQCSFIPANSTTRIDHTSSSPAAGCIHPPGCALSPPNLVHFDEGYTIHKACNTPFNHAKHCNGMHCRQPFINSSPPKPNKSDTEVFTAHSPNGCTRTHPPTHVVVTPPKRLIRKGSQGSVRKPVVFDEPARSTTPSVRILPDTLVSGAVNVASSAINTARSVLNMFSPPSTITHDQGRWENGHWISGHPEMPRERGLHVLHEMGFWDRDLNSTLLARYNDDIARVISELVQ